MPRRFAVSGACLVLLAAASCSPTDKGLLEGEPGSMILVSTEPRPAAKGKSFHGHPVLGETRVTDPKLRARIWKAILDAKGPAHVPNAAPAGHAPRHGITVVIGPQLHHLHLCFETGTVRHTQGGGAEGGDAAGVSFTISSAPEALLDEVLKGAEVPIAPKIGKD